MAADFCAKSVSFPIDEVKYLVGILRGTETFDKAKAWRAAINVANYIGVNLFGEVLAASVKDSKVTLKKYNKKSVAKALESMLDDGFKIKSWVGDLAWLIPVLLDLAKKFLENKKV